MMKKVMGIVLALSILLCLAACGNEAAPAETAESPSASPAEESAPEAAEAAPADEPESNTPEEIAPAPSDGEKRLAELIAETNPANKYEELAAALEICQTQFDLAVASTEKAGLSEDPTLSGLIAEWGQQLGDLRDYLKEHEGASEEELTALDEDADFMYYADSFLPALTRLYNMTSAIEKDPALWLKRYAAVPEAEVEQVECDGSWPEGYFFSDRVPAIEPINDIMTSASGGEYGFEDGTEYSLSVVSLEEEQARAYVDQLIEAGFQEESTTEALDSFVWFGRLNDNEGHISAAILYDGNAAGTAADPALLAQFYDYDIIGVMLDIGMIY